MHLEQFAVIVEDYDAAIAFFVGALGFELGGTCSAARRTPESYLVQPALIIRRSTAECRK